MRNFVMVIMLYLAAGCMPAPKDKKDILPPPESSFGSKRTYTNMVDYMFMQMTDTSAKLKEIFERQSELNGDHEKADELWKAYQEYEETYLNAAMLLLESDSTMDTLLKLNLKEDLNAFKMRHTARLAALNALRENSKSEARNLSNQMNALKIWATLPVLEKFLIESQPDTSHWQKMIRKMKAQSQRITSYPAFRDTL